MLFFPLKRGKKVLNNLNMLVKCKLWAVYLVHSVQKLRATGNHAFDLFANMYLELMWVKTLCLTLGRGSLFCRETLQPKLPEKLGVSIDRCGQKANGYKGAMNRLGDRKKIIWIDW